MSDQTRPEDSIAEHERPAGRPARSHPARDHAREPHAWLPLPLIHLVAHVSPSPARSQPHDPAAWLPLPSDVHALPSVSELLAPDPDVQLEVITEAEAVVHNAYVAAQAAVSPSPARAEPHDVSTWLPLPDVHTLPEVAPDAPPRVPRSRRLTRVLPPARALLVALLASITVFSAVWIGRQLTARGGSLVGVTHAFPVTVDFDGVVSTHLTTRRNATALARDLARSKLVEVRNTPGALHAGASVLLRTRHIGTLTLDGKVIPYDSPSLTVGELLETYSVVLVGDDRVEPSVGTRLSDGMTPTVVRVGGELNQETEAIPFTEVRRPDATLAVGQTRVVQEGVNGTMTVTYKVTTENGTPTGRALLSKVPAVAPRPRIVAYGTQADWHWDALAECESGARWSTVDAGSEGYDGGLGIYRPNWAAFGGLEYAPNAGLATREEQILVGQRIYNTYGWSAWGCARKMHWA